MVLATLELALNDRYGANVKKRDAYRSFSELLAYMIQDGLTDKEIPMVQRSGGSAMGFINGTAKPSFAEIRNKQAHGDPLEGFPVGGLLELVRDLIAYAYRDLIKQSMRPNSLLVTLECPHSLQSYIPTSGVLNTHKCHHRIQR